MIPDKKSIILSHHWGKQAKIYDFILHEIDISIEYSVPLCKMLHCAFIAFQRDRNDVVYKLMLVFLIIHHAMWIIYQTISNTV